MSYLFSFFTTKDAIFITQQKDIFDGVTTKVLYE